MPEEVKRLVEQFRGRVHPVLEVAEKGDTLSRAFDIFNITHVAVQTSKGRQVVRRAFHRPFVA